MANRAERRRETRAQQETQQLVFHVSVQQADLLLAALDQVGVKGIEGMEHVVKLYRQLQAAVNGARPAGNKKPDGDG